MIVLKRLWIVLSYLDVPHERYHTLHGLSCRFCFMTGCLPELVLFPANIIMP